MCVVSLGGNGRLLTACTTPAVEGMVIDSESEAAREARRFALEMLLTDHPNECMTCEVNGDCELQDLAYEYEVAWPEHDGARHSYEIDPDPNPFIFIDRNKCILCGRCVRACGEIQNRDVWSFAQRGFATTLVAGANQLMLDARCESCGSCVAYCPVGALYDRMSLRKARVNKVHRVRTTCPYCGVGCSFDLNVRDGKVVRVTSAPDAPANGMALCVKGRFGWDFVHHAERLTKPLIRQGDTFVEASWDEALDLVARRLGEIKAESGGDAIAMLVSAKCTNEDNYLAQKLARAVLGTNNVDHCARL